METNYLEKALEVANFIQGEEDRSHTLSYIAEHLAKYTENYKKSLEICRKVPHPATRSSLYSEIGYILADRGLGSEGIETILLSENLFNRVHTLLRISFMIQNNKERICWIHRVKDYLFAELKKDPSQKSDDLFKGLFTAFLEAKQFEEALALVDYLEDPGEKLSCLYQVAKDYVHEGEIDKALELAWKVEKEQDQSSLYDMIAKVWILNIQRDPVLEDALGGIKDSPKLYLEEIESTLVKHTHE
jgi:tetratricopeptide (TPR) repeat protein